MENALKEHPLIGQAMVHGDNRSYLVALLVLDPESAPAWAAKRGIDTEGGLAALVRHPEVRAEVDRAVAAANSASTAPSRSSGTNCSPRNGARRPVS